MNDLAAENVHLRNLLTDVVVAVDRLIDNWAESDAAVRKHLWRRMAAAAEAAADIVYPLDPGDGSEYCFGEPKQVWEHKDYGLAADVFDIPDDLR